MERLIVRILKKLLPGLIEGKHVASWGVITNISKPPSEGALSTDKEEYYAADVQLLDHNLNPVGPVYESVPLPVIGAGNNRGGFMFASKGARVIVEFAYGSPRHPFVSNVYALNKHLPKIDKSDVLIQQTSSSYLRADEDESWDLRARNKIRIGNEEIDLVKEVRRLAEILENHNHPTPHGISRKPNQSSSIKDVKNAVNKITT